MPIFSSGKSRRRRRRSSAVPLLFRRRSEAGERKGEAKGASAAAAATKNGRGGGGGCGTGAGGGGRVAVYRGADGRPLPQETVEKVTVFQVPLNNLFLKNIVYFIIVNYV